MNMIMSIFLDTYMKISNKKLLSSRKYIYYIIEIEAHTQDLK